MNVIIILITIIMSCLVLHQLSPFILSQYGECALCCIGGHGNARDCIQSGVAGHCYGSLISDTGLKCSIRGLIEYFIKSVPLGAKNCEPWEV